MNYKRKRDRVLSKINWITKLGIKDIEEVFIPEIPLTWEKFNNTEDEWVRLPFIEQELGVSACLYKAKAGSVFAPHYHNEANETLFVRKGGITITTPTYSVELLKNDAHTIEKGVPHICNFSKTEDSLIEITWCPPMKGWSGSFINR